MQKKTGIHFLKNNEVNKDLWNDCIANSDHQLIYAKTFYLDNISPKWSALTGANYEWVLPLTCRKKFGIAYLYQPPFTQQLGVFAKPGVEVPYTTIINYLQQHYRFIECNWNYTSPLPAIATAFEIKMATNFVLDLSRPYQNIAANYKQDLVRNLKRSKRFDVVYKQTNDYKKCISLYHEYYSDRMPHVKQSDYESFYNICAYAEKHTMVICREVTNTKNELLATALLLHDGNRLYNLINVTTTEGRKAEANHFLLDAVIKEFSGKDLLLDFEGSDLQGVKTFYQNFGGENQPYYMLKYNRLPWPLRLFKQ